MTLDKAAPGEYATTLDDEWKLWGPLGGYIAGLGLIAAGRECDFGRPASISCQFLAAARPGAVSLEVSLLRKGRTASCHRVRVSQGDRAIADIAVWGADTGPGLEHQFAPLPLASPPDETVSILSEEALAVFPFAKHVETRFVEIEQADRSPTWRVWTRFRPTPTFADPWLDAVRSVLLLDISSWPAARRPHGEAADDFMAPSLDLYVAFHRPTSTHDWLLVDSVSPVTSGGLLGWRSQVWDAEFGLVASGAGQNQLRAVKPTGAAAAG